MRILLVAPATDLPLATSEVAAVANTPGLEVRQLQGRVTQMDLVREIGVDDDGYQVIWFATHGGAAGVLLSDGLIAAEAIVALVVAAQIRLVYLNTCDSVAVANAIVQQSGADVIATIADVPDETAYRTGALFALWLARLGNYREAYERAKPGGNSVYLYLSGAGRMAYSNPDDTRAILARLDEIQATLSAISNRVSALELRGQLEREQSDRDRAERVYQASQASQAASSRGATGTEPPWGRWVIIIFAIASVLQAIMLWSVSTGGVGQ